MTRKNTYVPDGTPRDQYSNRHYCQDETASVVNDRWHCQCPGGPYFTSAQAMREHAYAKEFPND